MNDAISIAIIGGGVIGCCLAAELAGRAEDIFVFERNPGIIHGENQSSRNSGVLHAGLNYDQGSRPLKARLCVEGNAMWYKFCARHGVPCKKTGKLMVALDEGQVDSLRICQRQAEKNGIPDVRLISGGDVREREPNVKAHSALLVPSTGIVDPTRAIYQIYVLAANSDVQFMTDTEVVDITPDLSGVRLQIRYRDGNEDMFSHAKS